MHTSGGSAATRICGWGMVVSAGAAVGCSLTGVSPYPPLAAELALAGTSALFAVAWVVASCRRPREPDHFADRPRKPRGPRGVGGFGRFGGSRGAGGSGGLRGSRGPNPALPYVFGFGIALATIAAFLVIFTPSTERGRWEERMLAAGYGEFEVPVVRVSGEPEFVPEGQDNDAYHLTDVVVRVPFAAGPREVVVEGMYSATEPLAPGAEVAVYFAPGAPDSPVTEHDQVEEDALFLDFALAVWVWPWIVIAGVIMKSQMEASDLHRLRRFRPAVHLPALGILFAGLVLLLPMALEFRVAGYDQLPAFLASFTPALALTWVVRAS
ncbi:hypothetical protein [Streptomyces hydrogenans]|uniref:hypothetical protein n=1 Tax=Streptomyces hydrogenans TaxID=1873719 RepID=UPI00341DCF9D